MIQRVAIFGGSFDPPHLAHRMVVDEVLGSGEVDRVLMIPTLRHPFDKPLTDFSHRLAMCRLAVADLSGVEVSDIEAQLPGPSLTLNTLEELQRRHPEARFRLVIGSDLLAETDSWHAFDRIQALAPPYVIARAGHDDSATLPEISSTQLRHRLREGQPTDGLLAAAVRDYAIRHRLYAEG